MIYRLIVFILSATFLFSSCKKDFFQESGPGVLSFSNDSILFDTIFASVGSATQKFVVYNSNSNPVSIESIKLTESDPNNVYRINIDGQPIENSQNIKLAANDSLFVFVEVTVNPNNALLPFLVTNTLEFTTNDSKQNIALVAYGQNANFYTPSDNLFIVQNDSTNSNDSINIAYYSISENTSWTNELPHVIYGYIIVEPNAVLTIEEGTQIYLHENSGIIVGNPVFGSSNDGGTLVVNGNLGNEVVFQGDRLESWYENAPGQWDIIWMVQGSINNRIDHAIIKNGTVGLKVDTIGNSTNPTLTLSNTIIENMSDIGLFAQGSNVLAYNNVIKNCARYSLVLNIGGDYDFTHCTFANYYEYGSRNTPAVLVNNYYEDAFGNIQLRDLNNANFTNCIIDGSNGHEIVLEENSNAIFNYNFENCLLKIDQDSSLQQYNHSNSIKIDNSVTVFNNSIEQNFTLSANSPAINSGKPTFISNDILGNSRIGNPDMGAYEYLDN